ncbi:MAG TPA: enoyl-CoA hydratase-related protein [Chloroflexota bacterium]|nr:enoyl-CoA hydratase-related protein [Chloroflexota bacterium]
MAGTSQVVAGTSQAMTEWANRNLGWWHRQQGRPVTLGADEGEGDIQGDAPLREPVYLSVQGMVATVTLNRPQRRNAINLAAWRALAEIAGTLAADSAVRVVVLTGEGKAAFSAGSDVREFPQQRLGLTAARRYNECYEAALEAWAALPQPVVTSISGYCLGAALELALTADFRIASQDAVFGIPAVKLGIGISVADARRLIDVVGAARARALLLSGEQLTAAQAVAIGLVDAAVPAPELEEHVQARVTSLLANAPQTMAWVKRAVDFAGRHPDPAPFGFDVLGTQVFETEDCAEGVAAFLGRRQPSFRGT